MINGVNSINFKGCSCDRIVNGDPHAWRINGPDCHYDGLESSRAIPPSAINGDPDKWRMENIKPEIKTTDKENPLYNKKLVNMAISGKIDPMLLPETEFMQYLMQKGSSVQEFSDALLQYNRQTQKAGSVLDIEG